MKPITIVGLLLIIGGIAALVFVMIRLIPGDIVDLLVESAPDPVVEARIRSAP